MKYIAVVISGALAGLGGVFLVFIAGIYRESQTNGRGYIGLAALIFGNWRPGGLAGGAGLFGFADGLQLRSRSAVVALLLLVALILLAVVAVWQVAAGAAGGRRLAAVVVAVLALVGYLTIDVLPPGIVVLHPAPGTLLVLSLARSGCGMPKADGLVYRRGEQLVVRPTGTPCGAAARGGDDARLRAVLEVPGRRGRAGGRRAAWSPAATSRTPRTGWACAPSAAWSATWPAPAAAGWSPSPASAATGSR